MDTYNDTQSMRVRPPWIEDLITFYQGRIARQFVLHFNITDYIIDLGERFDLDKGGYTRGGEMVTTDETPQNMRQYLYRFLFDVLSCQTIYTYSLANGLTADDADRVDQDDPDDTLTFEREVHGPGMQRIYEIFKTMHGETQQPSSKKQDSSDVRLPADESENLKLLGHVLRQKYPDPVDAKHERPVAAILDFAEKLIPFHLGEGQGDREQLQALEVVQRWALDPQIRQTYNLIILLTPISG